METLNWISLYRPDPEHRYSRKERLFARRFTPHLVEALAINRLLAQSAGYSGESGSSVSTAICNRNGWLHQAEAKFLALLDEEWPKWLGGAVPGNVDCDLAAEQESLYVGRRIMISARGTPWGVLLKAERKSIANGLSPREREMARHFSAGWKHKEIAKALGLSPATVRHHLSAIYKKLGVRDKAELAQQLRD